MISCPTCGEPEEFQSKSCRVTCRNCGELYMIEVSHYSQKTSEEKMDTAISNMPVSRGYDAGELLAAISNMPVSRGYDAGELLAEIKAKDAEIARLAAGSLRLTEPELKLTMDAIRETHNSMEAAVILNKLQMPLDQIEKGRRAAADFASSLTDEEREVIKARRAAKSDVPR